MLKNDVFAFRHVHHPHLRRNPAFIVHRQAHAVGFRQRNPPAANASGGRIDETHHLPSAAVLPAVAHFVELTLDARQQAADCRAILSRNLALPLPEIIIANAFIIPDMQKFMRRNRHEIRPDLTLFDHACSSYA